MSSSSDRESLTALIASLLANVFRPHRAPIVQEALRMASDRAPVLMSTHLPTVRMRRLSRARDDERS